MTMNTVHDEATAAVEEAERITREAAAADLDLAQHWGETLARATEAQASQLLAAARQARMLAMSEEDLEKVRGFTFEPDFAEVMAGNVDPPDPIVDNLLYAEQVHWLSGHPGHGKTTLGMYIAGRVMDAGQHVVWIDWEAGKHPTARRLRAVGVPAEVAAERFHYANAPQIEATDAGFEPIARALEQWPGALIVLDSASKALSAAGLSEDSNTEATQWTTKIILPIRDYGGTALVIDHLTKSAKGSAYARGASAKLADTDVHWGLTRTRPFARDHAGEVELRRLKDREGALPERIVYAVGDGRGGLPIKTLEVRDADHEEAGERGSEVRTRVLGVLRKHEDTELSGAQVVGMTRGREAAIREALSELGDDPSAPVTARPGARNSVRYRYDRAAADALPVGGDEVRDDA